MPTYDYICNHADCGYRFEAVNRMRDKDLQVCLKCGGRCTSVPGTGRAPSTPRDWDEKEGTSLQLAFKPDVQTQKNLEKELGEKVPLTKDGAVHFQSDRHQRRLYKAMNAAQQRFADEDAERRDRRKPTNDDIKDAARAIKARQKAMGVH